MCVIGVVFESVERLLVGVMSPMLMSSEREGILVCKKKRGEHSGNHMRDTFCIYMRRR